MISCGLGPREGVRVNPQTCPLQENARRNDSVAQNGGKFGVRLKCGSTAHARQCKALTSARFDRLERSNLRIRPLNPGGSRQGHRIVRVPAKAARMLVSTRQAA